MSIIFENQKKGYMFFFLMIVLKVNVSIMNLTSRILKEMITKQLQFKLSFQNLMYLLYNRNAYI